MGTARVAYLILTGSTSVTVATPITELAGQLLDSRCNAAKSSAEQRVAALTLPSRPGGSWKLRFFARAGAPGPRTTGSPGDCTS